MLPVLCACIQATYYGSYGSLSVSLHELVSDGSTAAAGCFAVASMNNPFRSHAR